MLAGARIDVSHVHLQTVEDGIAFGRLAFLEHLPVELLNQKHRGPAGERVVVPDQFLARRPRRQKGNDFFLRQGRLAAEDSFRRKRSPVNVNMHGVIPNEGRPLQIDLGIERIARVEIKKSRSDLEPAEGKRRLDIFQPNHALQRRTQARAGQMQIHDGAAVGQIAANQKWVLGLDRDIEFPIADGRLRNGKIGAVRWRLRRGATRQADRDQIDVLEQGTVRQGDVASNGRALERADHSHVRVRARGERIVSSDQNTLRLELKIEIRFGQLWERDLPRDRERSARQIAIEALEMEDIPRERHARMETAQRRQSRVREPRHVDRDIARAAQHRFRDGSIHIHVERDVAIELSDAGQKLPKKIHGTARQLHLRGQRCFLIEFLFRDHFRKVEGNVAGDLQRLNLRLLQAAVESELIVLQLRHHIKRRGLQLRIIGAVQIAHLHVEAAAELRQRSLRVELHVDQPSRERRRAQVREKFFQVEILGLKGDEHFSIG